jgi:HEAT repeat protein
MSLFGRLLKPNVKKLESHGNVEALADLVESDEPGDLRRAAIEALGRIGGPEVTAPLIAAIGDQDDDVARAAEEAVAALEPLPGSELVEALSGPGADAALRILLGLDADAVEWIHNACSHADEAVRHRALGVLVDLEAEHGTPEVREMLFRTLLATLGDRSPRCRVLAATRLEDLGDPKAGRALAAQLKDGDETVREACRQALLAIGEPAVPNILDALADRNTNSRRIAAEVLGDVCSGEVSQKSRRITLFALAERASDANTEIAAAVHQALRAIPNEAVITAQLGYLAAEEQPSDPEEIEDFLGRMLKYAPVSPGLGTQIEKVIPE